MTYPTIGEGLSLALAKAQAELDAAPRALDHKRPADFRTHLVEAIDAALDAASLLADADASNVLREVARRRGYLLTVGTQ